MLSSERPPVTQAETLRYILDALPEVIPSLRIEDIRREVMLGPGLRVDALANAKVGGRTQELVLEVKSLGEPRLVEQAITQLRQVVRTRPRAYPVVAAPYLSERSRGICKAEGVGYVDLAGDAYLEFGSVLVDRIGAEGRALEKRGLRTLFAPKATRVLRTLLQQPSEPTTITKLAKTCSMSPAGAYLVVDLLDKKGLVTRGGDRSIVLAEPDRLLREWAKNWTWEKSPLSYYFSFDKTADQIMARVSETTKRLGIEYALTGMAGASLIAPFVRFTDVSFYLRSGKETLVKEMDLRPVSSGANVVILDPYDEGVFAGVREIRGSRVVSDIQLFVDLFNYPARGQEQAEALFEQAIKFPRAT
ncbi:MAG: hypothetical protein JRN54_03110 [Nitrososphaerota archaeon]|jgi:hypothetical protein|nr:hypothetical protein [Nitrososphaerota archaeon]